MLNVFFSFNNPVFTAALYEYLKPSPQIRTPSDQLLLRHNKGQALLQRACSPRGRITRQNNVSGPICPHGYTHESCGEMMVLTPYDDIRLAVLLLDY